MADFDWHQAVRQVTPYVVRIATPLGSGTGWVVSRSKTRPLCVVATAAHVIDHAHYWEEPIRILHYDSGKSTVLRPPDRAVTLHLDSDTAAVTFQTGELTLPNAALPMIAKDKYLSPGVEIGWLGFPAIPRASLSFFSGRISAWVDQDFGYLVDGVAINGVSGGPAFSLVPNSARLIGVVSAYIPNRATGEVLPGVAVVRDVMQFHDLAEQFRSLDEAKAEESPPGEQPASPAPGESKTRTPPQQR